MDLDLNVEKEAESSESPKEDPKRMAKAKTPQ